MRMTRWTLGVAMVAVAVAACGGVEKHESGGGGGAATKSGPIRVAVVPKAIATVAAALTHTCGQIASASMQTTHTTTTP